MCSHKKIELKLMLIMVLVIALSVVATGCKSETTASPVLTVMTHDSFAISEEVIQKFEKEHGVDVIFLQSGDTGAALNLAIRSRQNPIADVFYGVDNTFLSQALEADIFEAYASPMLDKIPDEFQLDSENRALPVDFGDVCINYDKRYFQEKDLAVPQSLADLLKPEYRGLLVVENPAISSPGLAFLLLTIGVYGEDGYLDYWTALRQNDVMVVNDWNTAYYTNFSGSSGNGSQPLVISYASSPVAEVIYASEPLDDAPTAAIVSPASCFRQIEFVGILKGTPNRVLAEAFVDFMLSKDFQEDLPEQMFVYPVNSEAALPESFIKFSQIPDDPVELAPDLISLRRKEWIEAWMSVVLR